MININIIMDCGIGCGHDHDSGEEIIIFRPIDISKIRCLNEKNKGSCQKIFKPYNERLNNKIYLESHENDPE